MPTEVQAAVLDPLTEEKTFVKVMISYPFRPLFCSGCNSLGHTPGACPKVNRVWVKKEVKADIKQPVSVPVPLEVVSQNSEEPVTGKKMGKTDVEGSESGSAEAGCDGTTKDLTEDEKWIEVKRKKGVQSDLSEGSPTPPQTFKNLRNVDEIEAKKPTKKLTKSQKKKLKLQQGSPSPSPNS